MRTAKARSAYKSAPSDQGLHCPLTESLDTAECMNGEQRPKWYFTRAPDDLNLRIMRMFEGSFSLDATQLMINCWFNIKNLQSLYGPSQAKKSLGT